MGASLAHLVGKAFHRPWPDCRVLVAAGAGAGLGTAFNAPIAGAVFVLEELVKRFERRIAIAALGASATTLGVARVLLGDAPDFHVHALGHADAGTRPLYFAFGAFAGLTALCDEITGRVGRFICLFDRQHPFVVATQIPRLHCALRVRVDANFVGDIALRIS
jgi:hypothetical protein